MKRFFGKKRPFWIYHCENCVTTLTHYYKRYHEPETGIRDLKQKKSPYNKAHSAD